MQAPLSVQPVVAHTTPEGLAASPRASTTARRDPMRILGRWLPWLLLLSIAMAAFAAGVHLRRWAFTYTQPIRFWPDIRRGFAYGARAIDEGLLNLYDNVARERPNGDYELDYAPLRLLVMRTWAVQTRQQFPNATAWNSDPATTYAFTRPVLRFNTTVEALTAIGVFLLTHLWTTRGRAAPPIQNHKSQIQNPSPPIPNPQSPIRNLCRPLLAALVIWFSPAQILSAQCWTTWDSWVIPFYVFAILLACLDFWFCAGLLIGIGAMFKGQQLFVAPLFILWPLFRGRFGAATRWTIGIAFAFTVVAAPWLVADLRQAITNATPSILLRSPAMWWLISANIAIALLALQRLLHARHMAATPAPAASRWPILLRAASAAVAFPLLLWPFLGSGNGPWIACASLTAAGVIAAALLLPLRGLPFVTAAVVVGVIFSCSLLFPGASFNWFYMGFGYGTRHWEWMTMGLTSNLPAILRDRYGWGSLHTIVLTIPAGALWLWPGAAVAVSLKYLLFSIYVLSLVLCAFGAAMHERRGDVRFLVAITAPWLLFFTIPGQIHERYLLWAAGVGATLIAVNSGLLLLDVFFMLLTWAMTINVMLNAGNSWFWAGRDAAGVIPAESRATLLRFVSGQHPDIGWAVILCAGIFLYLTLVPRRRGPQQLPLTVQQGN